MAGFSRSVCSEMCHDKVYSSHARIYLLLPSTMPNDAKKKISETFFLGREARPGYELLLVNVGVLCRWTSELLCFCFVEKILHKSLLSNCSESWLAFVLNPFLNCNRIESLLLPQTLKHLYNFDPTHRSSGCIKVSRRTCCWKKWTFFLRIFPGGSWLRHRGNLKLLNW